jgi:RNA polymerase sigma factor (sigma-70 family)
MQADFNAEKILEDASLNRSTLERQFERIMNAHGPSVLRLVSVYASDPASRQDLAQDIALALWTALPRFRGECSERTLVFRVAHNRALTHVTRGAKLHGSLDEAAEIPDTRATPESEASNSQFREHLLASIRRLSLAHRQVVVLLLEGMSYAEIADILGISEGNVAVRATRSRKELRMLLGDAK